MIKKREPKLFFIIFGLIFMRYCAYGFKYFPQLDDYIQHHNYLAFSEGLVPVVKRLGLLAARPLAGLLDITLWSLLFPTILGCLLISLLYALTGILLMKLFSPHFEISPLFLVIFSLLPLGFEGMYWLSASTRIVCGLFFAVLSAWLLQIFLQDRRRLSLLFSVLAFAACCGFYEQAMVFGIALTILTGMLNYRAAKLHSLTSLFVLPISALFFFLTSLVKNSPLYSTRLEIISPFTRFYWREFFPNILTQVQTAFLQGGFYTFTRGLARSFGIIFEDKLFLIVLVFIALAVLLYFTSEHSYNRRGGFSPLIVGFLLFLAPITPFLVIGNPWFSLRGTVMSFCGIALIADSVFIFLLGRYKRPFAAFTAGLAFLFCMASVAELHDYRETYLNDTRISTAIAELEISDQRVGIFGLEPSYLENQSFFYHEHIHGVTESAWALTGAVQYHMNKNGGGSFTPLSEKARYYERWNKGENRLENFDAIYYYSFEANQLTPLKIEAIGAGEFKLYSGNILFARAFETENFGLFQKIAN